MNKKIFYLSLLLSTPCLNAFALEQNYCAQSGNLTDATLQGYVGTLCQAGAGMQAALKAYEPANPNSSSPSPSHLAFGNPLTASTNTPVTTPAAAIPTPTVQNTPAPVGASTPSSSTNIYSNS